MTTTSTLKPVRGKSGHCATAGSDPRLHAACHVRWTTPSADVECGCDCHVTVPVARKIVPKK